MAPRGTPLGAHWLLDGHVALSNGKFARPTTAAIRDRRAYDVPVTLHDAV